MPSSSTRRLAERLLRLEAATGSVDPQANDAVRVCAKLGTSLTQFAGPEGFESLLRRALALARADLPALKSVTLKPGGSLEELESAAADMQKGGPEAAVAIIAHLLGLLVTFVGEALTMRMVREAWPDASWDE